MDNIAFATLKIGDFCFDIPIEVIKKAKPCSIECVTDIDKARGGVENLKHTIATNKDNVLENMKFLSSNSYEIHSEYINKLKHGSE